MLFRVLWFSPIPLHLRSLYRSIFLSSCVPTPGQNYYIMYIIVKITMVNHNIGLACVSINSFDFARKNLELRFSCCQFLPFEFYKRKAKKRNFSHLNLLFAHMFILQSYRMIFASKYMQKLLTEVFVLSINNISIIPFILNH